MMKRKLVTLLSVLLSAVLLFAFGIVLAACDKENEPPVDQHQHTFEWTVKTPASCSEEGVEVQVCKECKEEGATRPIAKTAHKYEWTTTQEASCSAEGLEEEICSVCKTKSGQSRTIQMTAHKPGQDLKVEDGKHYYTCTECGAKVNEEAHKAGEEYYQDEENNKHYQKCEVCQAVMNVGEHTPDYDHPERVDDETHCYKCSACGAVAETEAHVVNKQQIKIDKEKGTHYYQCNVCEGHIEEAQHEFEWQDIIVADCQKKGSHKQVCTVCQAEGRTEETEKTGHKSEKWIPDAEDSSKHYQLCDVCQTKFNEEAHVSDNQWAANVDEHYHTCTKCQAHIDIAEHTYNSGKTTCDTCGRENDNLSVETDFTFEAIDEGAAFAVTGYTGTKGVLNIPNTHENKPVTKIAANAFYDSSDAEKYKFVERVNIPANVTEIGNNAFRASGLTKVNVPATVTKLGTGVFQDCKSLTTATGFAGVSELTANLFKDSGLTAFTIPASVTTLGANSFESVPMKTVDIPSNVTEMAKNVQSPFYKAQLESITGLGGFTTLPDSFRNLPNLTSFVIPANITALESNSVGYLWTSIEEIRIPSTVKGTFIGSGFNGCKALKRIIFEKGGISVFGKDTFPSSAFDFMVIPNTVTEWLDRSVYTGSSPSTALTSSPIYYEGTPAEYKAIKHTGNRNRLLSSQKIYYYCEQYLPGYWHWNADKSAPELWTPENNPHDGAAWEINFTQDRYLVDVSTAGWQTTVLASVNSDATNKGVVYSTKVDEEALTLDAATGAVTGKLLGTFMITATSSSNPLVSTTCEVLFYSSHLYLSGTLKGEDASKADNYATYGLKKGADETVWVLDNVVLNTDDLLVVRYSQDEDSLVLDKNYYLNNTGVNFAVKDTETNSVKVKYLATFTVTVTLTGEQAKLTVVRTSYAPNDPKHHSITVAAMACGDTWEKHKEDTVYAKMTGDIATGINTITMDFTFQSWLERNHTTDSNYLNMCWTVAVDGGAEKWYDESVKVGIGEGEVQLGGSAYYLGTKAGYWCRTSSMGCKVWYQGNYNSSWTCSLTFTFKEDGTLTKITFNTK